MIVKIKGSMHEKVIEIQKATDSTGLFDWDAAHTPDLNQAPQNFIDLVDKLNYSLLSKTEETEFVYRFMQTLIKDNWNMYNDLFDFFFTIS